MINNINTSPKNDECIIFKCFSHHQSYVMTFRETCLIFYQNKESITHIISIYS